MAIRMWKNYTELGYLTLSYTFLRSLGAINAIVFAQILSEYNYAHNKGFVAFDSFFTSTQRMAAYLGIDLKTLNKAIYDLCELGLIGYLDSYIDGLKLIRVAENIIIEYQQNTEVQWMFAAWDTGLMRLQNPTNDLLEFLSTTQKLKEFIDNHLGKENAIPQIAYSICETVFRSYENNSFQFWKISDIDEKLRLFLDSEPIDADAVCRWVINQCKENS